MTVAQTDALLYLPGPSREELQKAVEIPALSEGWKGSFRAMLLEEQQGSTEEGGFRIEFDERTASGVARIPPRAGRANGAREQERDVAGAGASG